MTSIVEFLATTPFSEAKIAQDGKSLIDFFASQAYRMTYERILRMTTMTVSEARKSLYGLIDDVAETHYPVSITGKRNTAVLISSSDWSAIQETLYLSSIPGMKASIQKGLITPVRECSKDLKW